MESLRNSSMKKKPSKNFILVKHFSKKVQNSKFYFSFDHEISSNTTAMCSENPHLVLVLCGVVLGRHHNTPALDRAPVYGLYDVDHLLLVLQRPVDLVVVTRAQIDHDVLVPVEEHGGAGVVQLVHLVEVWHLSDVHQVAHSKVLHLLRDLVQGLVHLHALWVPVVAEADDHHPLSFVQDGLVHLPAVGEMGKHVRHGCVLI